MVLDISTDFTIFDNPEAVVVTLNRGDDEINLDVTDANRGFKRDDDVANDRGRLAQKSLVFFLPAEQMTGTLGNPSYDPRNSDFIHADDGDYFIDSISEIRFGTSLSGWTCSVFKMPQRENDLA